MEDLKSLVQELKKEFGRALWAVIVKKLPVSKEKVPKELAEKAKKGMIIAIINDMGVKKKFKYEKFEKRVEFLPLSNLWKMFYDQRYDLVRDLVGLSKISKTEVLYDYGIIDTLRKSFILKEKVIEKFKLRYVVSIILFGSWARGEAREDSDIDIAVVIDDTDVKRMAREEVRGRIWRMIAGMAAEIYKNFNIQVYLLTEFWNTIREAHPVIFTLLRDGVPIHDKGMFIPWRVLLKTGKIKPTPEAINNFIKSGDLLRKSVKRDLTEMIIEKLYYSILNLGQAALMFVGVSPPAHREVPQLLEETFVRKGLLDKKYARWCKDIIELRKEVEHGKIKELKGKDLDDWIERSKEFENATKDLLNKLEEEVTKKKIEEVRKMIDETIDKLFLMLEIKNVKNKIEELRKLVEIGKVPSSFLDFIKSFESIERGKVLYDEAIKLERNANIICGFVLSFVKEIRGKELIRKRLKIRYDDKQGEIWVFGDKVFITRDLSKPEEIEEGTLKNGKIEKLTKTTIEKFKEERSKLFNKPLVINDKLIDSIKKLFGKEVEVTID